MDFKALAVDVIACHGKQDVEWLTIVETVNEEIEDQDLEFSDEEKEKMYHQLINEIHYAKVVISWNDTDDEYEV